MQEARQKQGNGQKAPHQEHGARFDKKQGDFGLIGICILSESGGPSRAARWEC